MSYKAIYSYAWDLAELGVPAATAEFRDLGLDTVTLAGAYHAGKFTRPHGKTGKVYFPEDGTVYFKADPSRYGAIKPVANSLLSSRDILRELTDQTAMAVNVWLVLTHNTRLGMAHPESTVRNAFGDPYIYNLCPSAPEVRAYARALCVDVTATYPVSGISLETPGFMPYFHGYHHEFGLVRSNPWLENQLGLCFCKHCVSGAKAKGIDAERLKAVRKDANVAVIPSVARPTGGAWYEGTDLRAVGKACGIIEACFYEPSPMRVKADLFDIRRRVDPQTKIRGLLRPAFPDLASRGDLVAAVAALRAGGVEELAFYNYGHVRRSDLESMAAALRGAA